MTKLMIDRTFVRQDRQNLTIRQLTNQQFKAWTIAWYERAGARYSFGRTATSPEEREAVLAHMVNIGISPVMLRDDSGKEVSDAKL